MKQRPKNKYFFFIMFLCISFLASCSSGGGGGGSSVAINVDPCLDKGPALGATSGSGSLHFFSSCGLWAVDPDQAKAPAQIVPAYVDNTTRVAVMIPGSLKKIVDGTWDTSAQQVTDKYLHSVIYAIGTGSIRPMSEFFPEERLSTGDRYPGGIFQKVSASKSDSQTPVQVSSEDQANEMCGVVVVLEDYADINNSLYVYSMPGPDGDCNIPDDNVEKYIQPNMDKDTPPITLPPGRDIFFITDLVDKNTGAITGWLAVKNNRQQRRLPNYAAQTNTEKNVLNPHQAGTAYTTVDTSYAKQGAPIKIMPLGFRTGTPVLISGTGDLGGLNSETTYYVNPDKPTAVTFVCPESESADTTTPFFPPSPDPTTPAFEDRLEELTKINPLNLALTKRRKMVCLSDGTILGESAKNITTKYPAGGLNPPTELPMPYNANALDLQKIEDAIKALQTNDASIRVIKTLVYEEEVEMQSDSPVTLNIQASYIDLYRCNLEMTDCVDASATPLKETSFTLFCAELGFDQGGEEGSTPDNFFVIAAYDREKNPIDGEELLWRRGDFPFLDCGPLGLFCDVRDVTDLTSIGDAGPGKTAFKKVLGDAEDDGWNIYRASIDGLGSHIAFSISTPDSDQDSVPDYEYDSNGNRGGAKDQCPGTPPLTWVNNDGCPTSADAAEKKIKTYTPPSCKMREEFYILGIFPMSNRGSKAAFTGKLAVRIDLLYKPFWPLKDAVDENDDNETAAKKLSKAKKVGTQGVLYVYDIENNTFVVDPPYRTNDRSPDNLSNRASLKYISSHEVTEDSLSSFPDGLFSIYDNDTFYFADHSNLYRMPLAGNGLSSHMANEGTRNILDMKLSSTSLVYTATQLDPITPITTVKSVAKGGSGAITLFPDTIDTVLNLVTDQDWAYVYFQGLRVKPDLPNPGVYTTVYAVKTDGSENRTETVNATLAGRTTTRVLSVINCNDKGLFSCKKNGTLISVRGGDQSDPLTLGPLPDGDIDGIFFQGNGEQLLGTGFVDSEIYNVDIFHITANQAGSLERVMSTPLVPEELF